MPADSRWGISPRESVRREIDERGEAELIDGCIAMLQGDPVDPHLIYALGGPPARWAVAGGEGGPDYWLRVWGARGLLWVWDQRAEATIVEALGDDEWRVREMAAKVCARHQLTRARQHLSVLTDDERPRVRAAAERALDKLPD